MTTCTDYPSYQPMHSEGEATWASLRRHDKQTMYVSIRLLAELGISYYSIHPSA